MQRIAVNGVRYAVTVDGAGPAIILLHGFTGSAATWQPFIPTLAERHRVVAIDLVGHGRTEAPNIRRPRQMELVAVDLVAILDHLGIDQAVWLGYSMGGRVALYIAVTRPERVAALIAVGASPGIADPAARADRVRSDEALADAIEREGIEAFVDRWERLPLFASQARLPAQVRAALRRQRLANSPAGLANSLRGMGQGAQEPLLDRLSSVATPVLLIAGDEDDKFQRLNAAMAERLARAESRIIKGAGHAAHIEQPDQFLQAVETFLASIGRSNTE